VRKNVLAVVADYEEVGTLHKSGLSWSMIFERFSNGSQIWLTLEQAEDFIRNGYGTWAARRRLLITSRFEAFTRLRGLSAVAGDHVVRNRKEDWIGPFLRGQFLKAERGQ
jgi:hypothetical protein